MSEESLRTAVDSPPRSGRFPLWQRGHPDRVPAIVILAALAMVWLAFVLGSLHSYEPLPLGKDSPEPSSSLDGMDLETREQARKMDAEAKRFQSRLRSLGPRGIYIVVDTFQNRLYVKRADTVLLEAVCSTGSGLLLRDPETDRQWIFDTPRGLFHVRRKARDPVWTKPDWAFIEEGKPVPDRWRERLDEETLGDYALYFGDGYMIHGTLYQRYLGSSITHGCVRLGDDDLKRVYEKTPVGAAIYIF